MSLASMEFARTSLSIFVEKIASMKTSYASSASAPQSNQMTLLGIGANCKNTLQAGKGFNTRWVSLLYLKDELQKQQHGCSVPNTNRSGGYRRFLVS